MQLLECLIAYFLVSKPKPIQCSAGTEDLLYTPSRLRCAPCCQVPEVPLVLSDAVESVSKTSKALEVLKKIGAVADVEKAKDSKSLRRGKGELPAFVAWL